MSMRLSTLLKRAGLSECPRLESIPERVKAPVEIQAIRSQEMSKAFKAALSNPNMLAPHFIEHCEKTFARVCESNECCGANLQAAIMVMLKELRRLKSQP